MFTSYKTMMFIFSFKQKTDNDADPKKEDDATYKKTRVDGWVSEQNSHHTPPKSDHNQDHSADINGNLIIK